MKEHSRLLSTVETVCGLTDKTGQTKTHFLHTHSIKMSGWLHHIGIV